MKSINFVFILSALLFSFTTLVVSSSGVLDIGINGCEDRNTYSLVFKGLRNYGKITSRNEKAAFVAGMSEIRKSRRIVSRIKNSEKKQVLILRIDTKTYDNLKGLSESKDIEAEVRKIAEGYQKITNWRLFYVMLPYGAPEIIVDVFNNYKISVVSTAVKVPEDLKVDDVSVLKGVVIVDTASYDFEQDNLEKLTDKSISLSVCIPRGSEADFIPTATSPGPFSLLIKGGLKHYDIVKIFDTESPFVVTLSDISDNEGLIRRILNEGRALVVSLSRAETSSQDAIDRSVASILSASNRLPKRIEYALLPSKCHDTSIVNTFSNSNIKAFKATAYFTSSETDLVNFNQPFIFNDYVIVDLDVKQSAASDDVLAERTQIFKLLNTVNTKIDRQGLASLPLSQLINNISEESKCDQLRQTLTTDRDNWFRNELLNISRTSVFEESYRIIRNIADLNLKQRIFRINFANEDGIDAGGVTKEWYTIMMREIFDTKTRKLFKASPTDNNTFHPNAETDKSSMQTLEYFKFIGRLIAKSVIDNKPIGMRLSRALTKVILGRTPSFYDLKEIDYDMYKSLVKTATETDSNTLSDMCFTNTKGDVELKPGGENIEVSDENKFEYVYLLAQYIMITSCKPQIDAFVTGFHRLISRSLLSSFTVKELQTLISGNTEIDIDRWESITTYSGFSRYDDVIRWFWRAVRSFKEEDDREANNPSRADKTKIVNNLVRFITGSITTPTSFTISRFDSLSRTGLPRSHTCFNSIDLPNYQSYDMLRRRLRYAAEEGNSEISNA